MIPVECIARGYLAGLGLASYNEGGSISGIALPRGLSEASQLPDPVFTPTTKAAAGHDEPVTYSGVVSLVGEETASELRRITLEVYREDIFPDVNNSSYTHTKPFAIKNVFAKRRRKSGYSSHNASAPASRGEQP